MSADLPGWERVENSAEAAIGGGILSEIVRGAGSSFVRDVRCDPRQTGDEVQFIVIGGNAVVGPVYLRVRVDEVTPRDGVMPCSWFGKPNGWAQTTAWDRNVCTECGAPVERGEDGWRHDYEVRASDEKNA